MKPYWTDGQATIWHANALSIPLADDSVDLICTSPPYFGLRAYQDNGETYSGQLGSEATPAEFVDALIAATREMVRVLKPSGSLWINLGDRYATDSPPGPQGASGQRAGRGSANEPARANRGERERRPRREQFTREDAAWLAGVIDSDGSIGIHINQQAEGRSPSFVPWVRVGQMRSEVVERIAELVGTGRVSQDKRGVWTWAASAQQARWVLERIHPWLLIKRRQAWAAVEVARHVEERNAKGSWRQLTTEDVAYRQRLREAVMAWNQGEPDDLVVSAPPPVSLPLYPLAPRAKSLHDVPHAYAAACVGYLGLIKRAEIIWNKPNGLPESVTDRVRRSHEVWFHFTLEPRYYSAVDEVREEHSPNRHDGGDRSQWTTGKYGDRDTAKINSGPNPLGKLPGSVWTIPTQPLRVPDHLGIDHFAAFPMEWPRRIIRGWSPRDVCGACGEGRRPVVSIEQDAQGRTTNGPKNDARRAEGALNLASSLRTVSTATITGYACACPDTTAPTTPGVVLDPFGGTGTSALVAVAEGRTAHHVDLSADYCRLAQWRITDPGERARAREVEKPPVEIDGQDDLLELLGGIA